jgi:TP901 family phage tail tape measure protein
MSGKFSIETTFKAKDEASAIVKKLEGNVGKFTSSTERQLRGVDRAMGKVHGGLMRIGAAAVAGSAIAGGAIAEIVKTGMEFEKTLVGAAAKFDPELKRGTKGFEELKAAAMDVGSRTEFSSTMAAEALKSLASAGFGTSQAIAALPGVVDLATASEVDLGAATDMATKSLGAFGLQTSDAAQLGKNLARVSDAMATAANKTNASMEGLFESIKEGAPVATQTGASLETFIAMASKLADAGIEGSQAGTTLKDMFLMLAAPVKKGADQLAALGVKTRGAHGNMRDMIDILGDLEKKTAKMGTAQKAMALQNVFGKIPIAGAMSLLKTGASDIGALRTELEGASGSTKKMAETMRDTVAGDLDKFKAAVDSVKISIFDMNEGPIRDVIKSTTEWALAHKDLIKTKVGEFVKGIADNLPLIVERLKQIGKAVAVFYALDAAVKVARLGVALYVGVVKAAGWATKAFGAEAVTTSVAVDGVAKAGKFAAMGESINGITSLLGKAGMSGAALSVGVAFGTWLDHQFGISTMISGWLAQVTGLNKEIDKAGGRSTHRELVPGESKVYDGRGMSQLANGDIVDSHGKLVDKTSKISATPIAVNPSGAFGGVFDTSGVEPGGMLVPENESSVVSPQDRSTTHTTQAELVIRDETGRAEITKGPKGGGLTLKLKPSGAF